MSPPSLCLSACVSLLYLPMSLFVSLCRWAGVPAGLHHLCVSLHMSLCCLSTCLSLSLCMCLSVVSLHVSRCCVSTCLSWSLSADGQVYRQVSAGSYTGPLPLGPEDVEGYLSSLEPPPAVAPPTAAAAPTQPHAVIMSTAPPGVGGGQQHVTFTGASRGGIRVRVRPPALPRNEEFLLRRRKFFSHQPISERHRRSTKMTEV